jgi:hypothetical protein
MIIRHFKTPSVGELCKSLAIGDINTNYPQIVYQLKLTDIKAGDIIIALSEAEFTSENDFIVWTRSGIILSDDPDAIDGVHITEWNGHNVNKLLIHHITHIKHGTYVVDKDYPVAYISFIACADGCIPKPYLVWWKALLNKIGFTFKPELPNIQPLVVEQNYGHLSVLVIN